MRAGVAVLAGRPNVGKSTLANALAGVHVAAVSPRAQTTRRRVLAVANGAGWQAVLIDLPGFQRPADRLTERMQATVDRSIGDGDVALFVLNAAEVAGGGDRFIAQRLSASGRPVIIVLNQVDRLEPGAIAAKIAEAALLVPNFVALHPTSALTGDGLDALASDLGAALPHGPRLFPVGMATDQTDAELAAELIREAVLVRVRDEIPHAVAVIVDEIASARTGRIVRATIVVEHESQKGIVVGHKGSVIAATGRSARAALARVWGVDVHTDITVKVRPRWRRDDSMLDRLGV